MTIPRRPPSSRQQVDTPRGQVTTHVVDKAQRPSGSLNRVALAAGEEQDRRAAPDRNAGVTAPLLPRLRDMLFWSLQRVFAVVILRSQDGVPEYTERTETPAITNPWGWFPFLALGDACSLLIIAHAFTISRKGESGFEALLLSGFCLLFLPTIIRLILPGTA